MTRLLAMYSRAAAAFNAKLQAFTERNLALAEEVRTIGHEDAGRPIEDMPFAERHARIVKYRKAYMVIAAVQLVLRAAQLAKIATLCAVAVGIGVAIAHVVNVMVTP